MKKRRPVLAWAAGAALLGLAVAWFGGSRFSEASPLEESRWNVVTVGRQDSVGRPDQSQGAVVLGGALEIRKSASKQSDVVTPRDTSGLGAIRIELAPDSAGVQVVLRGSGAGRSIILRLDKEGWKATGNPHPQVRPNQGDWTFVYDGRGWFVQDGDTRVPVGELGPGSAEITAFEGDVRIRRIQLANTTGTVFLDEDFRGASQDPLILGAAAVAGAFVGLLASLVGSPLAGAALLGLPVLVFLVPARAFTAGVELFYLTGTTATQLFVVVLVTSLLPLFAAAVLGSRALNVHRTESMREWLVRASPGLLMLVSGYTAWLGLLYVMLVIASNAKGLPARRAKRASDVFFLVALLFPLSLEVLVRSTYLDTAWDAERLAGQSAELSDWRNPPPFWRELCGDPAAQRRVNVVFTGGSSTGGAYQFRGEPEAFFPTQTHRLLCTALPTDGAIRTSNFGDGGRDSFTVSRSISKLIGGDASDLVVFYGGVNDLLTTTNRLTRKQREERQLTQGAAADAVEGWVGYSRLITGLSLPFHVKTDGDAENVPEVPLADAKENLERVAKMVGESGGKLLLVTEYVRGGDKTAVLEYDAMQRSVADAYDHVEHFDVYAALDPFASEPLLLDRNHLSRHGGARLANALAPKLAEMAGLSGLIIPEITAPAPGTELAPPTPEGPMVTPVAPPNGPI